MSCGGLQIGTHTYTYTHTHTHLHTLPTTHYTLLISLLARPLPLYLPLSHRVIVLLRRCAQLELAPVRAHHVEGDKAGGEEDGGDAHEDAELAGQDGARLR